MTKNDAIALEELCEDRFSERFGQQVKISMGLLGRLNASFPEGYITFDYKSGDIIWFRYNCFLRNVFIDNFDKYCQTINEICATPDYKKDLETLAWVYEHHNELKDG